MREKVSANLNSSSDFQYEQEEGILMDFDRYVEVFNKETGIEEILAMDMNLEDTIRWFFKKIIEFRRTDRPFLAAIQSEMFSNPDDYMELLRSNGWESVPKWELGQSGTEFEKLALHHYKP